MVTLNNISIYPNPATNVLTIDMSTNQDEITRNFTAVEIYNTLGEKVKTVNRMDAKKVITLSISDLPNGIFVTTLIDANGNVNTLGRFVKQ